MLELSPNNLQPLPPVARRVAQQLHAAQATANYVQKLADAMGYESVGGYENFLDCDLIGDEVRELLPFSEGYSGYFEASLSLSDDTASERAPRGRTAPVIFYK